MVVFCAAYYMYEIKIERHLMLQASTLRSIKLHSFNLFIKSTLVYFSMQ